jgi:hypothetical protein
MPGSPPEQPCSARIALFSSTLKRHLPIYVGGAFLSPNFIRQVGAIFMEDTDEEFTPQ